MIDRALRPRYDLAIEVFARSESGLIMLDWYGETVSERPISRREFVLGWLTWFNFTREAEHA